MFCQWCRRGRCARALPQEPGTYPGGDGETIIPFTDEKNAEREIIHGRFAMLGVTGAWAAENGTGIPWFEAGALCTPDDCTAVADKFPGAIAPLAPEGSGYPSYWVVIGTEVCTNAAAAQRLDLGARDWGLGSGLPAGSAALLVSGQRGGGCIAPERGRPAVARRPCAAAAADR